MPSLAIARAANASFKPAFVPTAVFVGGTSGIGQGMVEAFAQHTNGAANIVIVGRNRDAAEKIIASFPKPPSTDIQHQFVSCDASLMKNIAETSRELTTKLPRINYLVVSCGITTGFLAGRAETTEGIDRKLALHYYARWKFIDGLLPSLQRAKEAGEEARAMTVMSAGLGGSVDLNDLGLKKRYSFVGAVNAIGTYNDLAVKEFAVRYPTISFHHTWPGPVETPLNKGTMVARALTTVIRPLLATPDHCAEWMLYPLLDPKVGSGAYLWGRYGDALPMKEHLTDEAAKKLWEHTLLETKTD